MKNKTMRPAIYAIALLTVLSLAAFGVHMFGQPASAAPGSGAIWTTENGCGTIAQDLNHYNVGEHVWINGSNFDAGNYAWSITGQPGNSSGDPNTEVASGNYDVDSSGEFCFLAYTVAGDDWGEYKVAFGKKGDNYRVNNDVGLDWAVISGYKFNDVNMNGVWDAGELPLNNWEICMASELLPRQFTTTFTEVVLPECVFTGDGDWPDGYYEFLYYSGYKITLTETLQAGWTQSAPVSGAHVVEIPYIDIFANNDFGNYVTSYCGDGVVNQESEECDGTDGVGENQSCTNDCTLVNHAYCGDGIVNGEEQCDGSEGCTAECTLIEPLPVLSLDKLCTPNPVGAGENITYTLNWAIEEVDASGLVLMDEIPANTSFVSASDPGVYDAVTNTVMWNFGIVGPGNYVTSLVVEVDSPLMNGTEIANTATLESAEVDTLLASCDVTVSSGPILEIEKVADETVVNPGQTFNYTVKVTNTGTDTAYNVRMIDELPEGFTLADDGKAILRHTLGDIASGDSVAYTFAVVVGLDVDAGNYVNVVTVGADNYVELQADVDLDVIVPLVLGEKIEAPVVLGESTELPVTGGSGILAVLSVIATVAGAGFISYGQIRKQ
ncbi:NEW3 domain-containing protein [Patescibacteria group bacterium]